jgi:murein tripeptide amidase MpaA
MVLAVALSGAGKASEKPLDLTWDHYYDQDQVTEAVEALSQAYPKLTRLQSLGKSAEGRDIWALTITNEATGADTDKPGIYVDAAIHGNEIQGTEVALYLAWTLLDGHGKQETLTDLVDTRAFYIVPTVNVDSRARFFSHPGGYNIGRTARVPHDDDRDGASDEDDYEDLDGDGEILMMRIRDPQGDYRTHPDDPRVLQRVQAGQKGEWTLLGLEGVDNDGDGQVNEDPPGFLDMNRNYGFKWQPRYVQNGSGEYPMSAANTQAVARFVVEKPNIVVSFAFHNYGGMYLRGPGSDLAPPYSPADVRVYDHLGEESERAVPGYRYMVAKDDLYTTHGDFDEFMYQVLGVYAFTPELYMPSQDRYRREGDDVLQEAPGVSWEEGRPAERERQRFNDRLMQGQMFKDWTPFQHPSYGEVEIGGWRPFTTRQPQPFMIHEMLHRNASFVLWTATQTPRIEVEVTEVEKLGQGLYRVRARAVNTGAIPTLSAQARNRKVHPLDHFSIAGDDLTVVSGAVVDDPHLDLVTPVDHRPQTIPTYVAERDRRDVQWIVEGRGPLAVTYEGVKITTASADSRLE